MVAEEGHGWMSDEADYSIGGSGAHPRDYLDGDSYDSPNLTVFTVDDELLRKRLNLLWLIHLIVWAWGLLLFIITAADEYNKRPPSPPQWALLFLCLIMLGVLMLYCHRKAEKAELAENLGSKLIIQGYTCSLLRPMRKNFPDVKFNIQNLRFAYADSITLTLVFWKKEPWMRRPLPGFYPTVYLIGVKDAKKAARTLWVRSGAGIRLHQARNYAKKFSFVVWIFIAAGWPLIFLTFLYFPNVSMDIVFTIVLVLLSASMVMLLSALQGIFHRCKIRARWKRR